MPIIQPPDPSVKDPTKASLPVAQNAALANLDSRLSSIEGIVLNNGSFELPVSGSGDPTSWTISDTGAASHALDQDESDVYHGRQSLSMTLTSTAGDLVTMTSDDYIPCAPGQRLRISWNYKCSVAATRQRIDVLYWYWTGSAYSAASTASASVFDISANNSATWTQVISDETVVPGGLAHDPEFYTIQVRYGDPGGGTDGTAGVLHIDGVQSEVFHGLVQVPYDHANGSFTLSGSSQAYTVSSSLVGYEKPHTILVMVFEEVDDDYTIVSYNTDATASTNVINVGTGVARELTLTIHLDHRLRFSADVDDGSILVKIIGYYV
ncbi:MAG: hypothetical protein ACTSYH_03590 [Candidatus Heimdallarchaeaceae archaeon]